MKKTILLLILSFNLSVGFTQTKYYYNYYCGIYGTCWMPIEKDSANYYSFVDLDTLITGEIVFYDTDGKVFAKDYYESWNLSQSKHFYKNGKKKYILSEQFNTKSLDISSDFVKVYRMSSFLYMKNIWDTLGSKLNMKDSCLFREYYPNRKIMREGIYFNGFPIGTWRLYYQNGNLMCQGSYSGMYNKWSTNFILSSAGDTLVKKGRGKFTISYPNGKPSYTGEYRNGQLIGQFQAYYPNGQVWYQVNYSEGFYNGKYESYYSNGYVKVIGKYNNGARTGEWRRYDKHGRLMN